MAFSRGRPSDEDEQQAPQTDKPATDASNEVTPSEEEDTGSSEQEAEQHKSVPPVQTPDATRPLSPGAFRNAAAAVTQPLHPLLSEQDANTPSEETADTAADSDDAEATANDDADALEDDALQEPAHTSLESADVQAHLADIDTDFLAPIDEPIPSYNADLIDPTAKPRVKQARSARNVAVAALRDVGRVRHANQDSVLAMLTSLPRESSDVTMALLIVADGMGGHAGGEIASRLAIRTVTHYILANLVLPLLDDEMLEALQSIMIEAVQEANQTIWDQAQMTNSDMGTTCTAALLLGHGLYIAHVGDSRAYLLDDDELRALTADHSTVGRLIEMGQLSPHQAREHPLRNQLYRTIGQQPEVEVDFVYESLHGSSHVLLCSDGLWGMISEEQIRQALTHSPWPQDACQELITLANLAGGEDNISAVVMTLPVAERPRS